MKWGTSLEKQRRDDWRQIKKIVKLCNAYKTCIVHMQHEFLMSELNPKHMVYVLCNIVTIDKYQ
jgi:hypothetical protein